MSRRPKKEKELLSPEAMELFAKDPGAYLALMEAIKIAKAKNKKHLDLNTLNMTNALFSTKPRETQTIKEMEEVWVPTGMKARHAEIKATKTKVQEFLDEQTQIGKTLAQDIEKEFTSLLVNQKKYSKTVTINKIYKLLTNIAEYKLRMYSYPRSSVDMVKALNILVGIIKQLNPTEITLLTNEFRYTDKNCVELLIQIASGLPENYIKQVNIDQVKTILEAKLIPPVEKKNESKNQVAKDNKKNQQKKAKIAIPTDKESKFKYELKVKHNEEELKPILKKSIDRQYINTKFVQSKKKKNVKHVRWENEAEYESPIKEQNFAAEVEQKPAESNSSSAPEFFIQITPLESPISSAESNSALTHVEQKSFEPKSTQKAEISNLVPIQVGKNEPLSKTKFIWKSKSTVPAVTKQPESPASPIVVTRTVEAYEKIKRTFSPTGSVQEEIIERKMVASEQVEVVPPITFKPHMWYWQPAKIVTEYAITASLIMSYLECMQAETIKLAKLILAGQPQNGGTLNTYYEFVSNHNNYIKFLYAQLPHDAESDFNCPVNPKSIQEIISSNLEMHTIFETLFKASDYQEYKDLISICVGLREENIRILKAILPQGYWVSIEDAFIALPVPELNYAPEPFPCRPSHLQPPAPVAVESKNSFRFFKQPKPIIAAQKTTEQETKRNAPATSNKDNSKSEVVNVTQPHVPSATT